MLSQMFVCPEAGLIPSMHQRSYDQHPGVCIQGVLHLEGGVCIRGVLPTGEVCVWAGVLPTGVSAYRGRLIRPQVHILLECFLVLDL